MGTIVARARDLLRDIWTLYFICRDPEMPSYAKAVALGLVIYAVSPIDLLPDVVPALGFLDELLIIPAGPHLVRQLIPAAALAKHRGRADRGLARLSTVAVAGGIAVVWVVATIAVARYLL